MEKTLGGERLGSGNKLKVSLHGYERSTHNLGYLWRSSMSAGTLVPFMSELALPGDTFDIDLDCDVKTLPTVGPLFGSYKVQLDVFQAPIRLYHALLHNNALGIGMNMENVKLPQLSFQIGSFVEGTPIDTSSINPSSIFAYLGIRGVGYSTLDVSRKFNAIPYLAYWDIYKNYYANKQEMYGQYIHLPITTTNKTVSTITNGSTTIPQSPTELNVVITDKVIINYTTAFPPEPFGILLTKPSGETLVLGDMFNSIVDSGTYITLTSPTFIGSIDVMNWKYLNYNDQYNGKPVVTKFLLSGIDDMRNKILQTSGASAMTIKAATMAPYGPPLTFNDGSGASYQGTQEGLGLKTYQSDIFNNWIQTEWIDGTNGINAITAIDTTSGSFTIDTLNLANKVYNMLNRIAVSGGTYDDWLDAVYAHDRYKRCETPMYMGGLSKELIFQEVVSNSETETQPLGSLAGRGRLSNKHKGGHIVVKVDEPSYILGIVSLTPRIDYSQGNRWDIHLETMNDLHKPALDQIGFQELITEQMAWWDTHYSTVSGLWEQRSAGKQPAWLNYMTNYNRTYGNFAIEEKEMFMTLNRRYEPESGNYIKDLTTYIDPSKYNFIFAETNLDAQNFWTQIAVDITARRKMSAKTIPNL